MKHRRAFIVTASLLAGAIAAGLVAAGCGTGQAPAPADDVRSQIARLQKSTSLLQRQIDLANGKEFYLVLDPAAGDITLMLRGAELQRYQVIGLQVGQPRVSWVTRPDPRPWQDVVWAQGELDPPRQIDRLVIQAAPPGKEGADDAAAQVPPTPEEMYPVPSRYHVRFNDGLSIEIRPLDADTDAGRWARLRAWFSAKWHDATDAAFTRERDAVRLRIALSPKDAASLYRSLPPAVRLIILSGSEKTALAASTKPSGVPAKPAPNAPAQGAAPAKPKD
jgi:hypothetical protein